MSLYVYSSYTAEGIGMSALKIRWWIRCGSERFSSRACVRQVGSNAAPPDKKDTKDIVWEVLQQVNERKAMEVYNGEHRVAQCQEVYRNPVEMGGHDELDV
mmetsp:Transcript_27535/g.44322  ORF Transcript_27535/g.44322 Transcript_27535/m.44322 type:complete len:101 (-) Transcript_27535:124-426(-)